MVVNDVVLSDRLHQTAKLPHRRLRPTAILQLLQANAKNLFLAAHLSYDIIQTSFQRLKKTEIILVVGQNLKRFDRPERQVGQRDFDLPHSAVTCFRPDLSLFDTPDTIKRKRKN